MKAEQLMVLRKSTGIELLFQISGTVQMEHQKRKISVIQQIL